MRIKRLVAAAFTAALMTSALAAPAFADDGSVSVDVPYPVAGPNCYQHVTVWWSTTGVPPAGSNGYVVCR